MTHVSPLAEADIRDILDYIAQHNPKAARKVRESFRRAIDTLVANPYIGHAREDLTKYPVRFWPVYSYQIVYRVENNMVHVARVLSGYRDIAFILGASFHA